MDATVHYSLGTEASKGQASGHKLKELKPSQFDLELGTERRKRLLVNVDFIAILRINNTLATATFSGP